MKPFVYRQIIAMALMGSVTTFSPSVRAEFFAPADSPESEYLSTRLEIDLADLDMSDWDLKSANQLFFDQVSNALYGGQGVPQADDKAEARVVVKLSWVDAGAAHYAVKVTVMRDDAPPATTEFECEGCGDSEVGQAIEAHLEEIVPYLERKTDSATPAIEEGGLPQPEEIEIEPEIEPEPAKPTQRPLGPLGKTGIGVGVSGLLVAGGGALIFMRGRQLDNPQGAFPQAEEVNYRPPGVVVMLAGGAMFATGAVLFVLDRTRGRKRGQKNDLGFLPTGRGMALVLNF